MGVRKVIQERYELVETVGRGGMAEVWRARDHHLNRDVAVKFIDARLAEDPDFLVRFFSEAQAAARINHPNVVEILDFGEIDGQPFLVMELVGGGALSELNEKRWRPEIAAQIVAQAAAGAGAAHEAGLVHRDIKPSNILLDDNAIAKLADFGVAASSGREKLTATGTAIGSPRYLSPEQATGKEAIPASDVYSLGAVLYELLTGAPPFVADNATAIAIAHVEKEPQPPSEIVPDLPRVLEDIVLAALAKDPRDRPQNGTALAEALSEALRKASAGATALVSVVEAPGVLARSRTKILAALVAASIVGGGLVLASAGGEDGTAEAAGQAEFDRNLDAQPPAPKTSSPATASAPDSEPTPTPTPTETDRPKRDPKGEDVSDLEQDDDDGPGDAEDPKDEPTPEPTPEPTEPTSAPSSSAQPSPLG